LVAVADVVVVANAVGHNAEAMLRHHSHSTSLMLLMALPPRCISLQKQCAPGVKAQGHAPAPHLNHVRNAVVVVQSTPTKECFPFLHRARGVKEKEPLLNTHVVHAVGRAVNIVPEK
jgi:hypothetical protein